MRECGECIACCVYPRIPALKKEGMVACPNLTESSEQFTGSSCTNCTTYEDRPSMCSEYRCAWLIGCGKDNDRPDKSFMLFDCSKQIDNCLEAKPLKENQENTNAGIAVIERMSKDFKTPVVVLNFYERRVVRIVGRGI